MGIAIRRYGTQALNCCTNTPTPESKAEHDLLSSLDLMSKKKSVTTYCAQSDQEMCTCLSLTSKEAQKGHTGAETTSKAKRDSKYLKP